MRETCGDLMGKGEAQAIILGSCSSHGSGPTEFPGIFAGALISQSTFVGLLLLRLLQTPAFLLQVEVVTLSLIPWLPTFAGRPSLPSFSLLQVSRNSHVKPLSPVIVVASLILTDPDWYVIIPVYQIIHCMGKIIVCSIFSLIVVWSLKSLRILGKKMALGENVQSGGYFRSSPAENG